ncbi:hypothetical protein F5Y03DRAFT_396084 [Xylaria venustula]|nr:hypothetical protein F5Y03DRAFT_396084 [Xylaria venustula]
MNSAPTMRKGPRPSRYPPQDIENELRIQVLDAVEVKKQAPRPTGNDEAPQVIIGNLESGCRGTYFHGPCGTEFVFHYCKMQYATQCKCIIQAAGEDTTYQLPADLDRHRIRLILGQGVRYRLEPKLAGIVAMKIFLGMDVPEPLRMTTLGAISKRQWTRNPHLDKGKGKKNKEDSY